MEIHVGGNGGARRLQDSRAGRADLVGRHLVDRLRLQQHFVAGPAAAAQNHLQKRM